MSLYQSKMSVINSFTIANKAEHAVQSYAAGIGSQGAFFFKNDLFFIDEQMILPSFFDNSNQKYAI